MTARANDDDWVNRGLSLGGKQADGSGEGGGWVEVGLSFDHSAEGGASGSTEDGGGWVERGDNDGGQDPASGERQLGGR